MSSRYQPNNNNDTRFAPRGRSPPRYDRRPSVPSGGFPNRSSDSSSYRPADDNFNASREPPRGPRQAPFTPRGRGSFSRGRGGYDSYNRRENDRSWSDRRDNYDDRRVSPVGRARSRSPPFRDSRDAPDSARAFDSPTDYRNRGGFGARGRGFESRGRGRTSASSDRDGTRPRPRSTSRERYPDGDSRDGRFERDRGKRDDDRWDREKDPRRDLPPIRAESRPHDDHPRTASPSAASSASAPHAHTDSSQSRAPKTISESVRRSSFPPSSQSENAARDSTRQTQPAAHPPSSPRQAPSVPAYGSTAPISVDSGKTPKASAAAPKSSEESKAPVSASNPTTPGALSIPTAPRADLEDPLKDAPKAPKADLAKAPPTQPSRRSMSNTMPPVRPFETQESPRASGPVQSPQIPSGPRALVGSQPTQGASFGTMAGRIPTGPKAFNQPTSNVWRPGGRAPPQGPAATSAVPKREPADDERSVGRASQTSRQSMKPDHQDNDDDMSESDKLPRMADLDGAMEVDGSQEDDRKQLISDMPLDSDLLHSDDDEDDLIDHMSEEDLRAQEAKFARQKEELEARRPPPDTEDTELLGMLDELDALAVALADIKAGKWPPPAKQKPTVSADDPTAKAVPADNTDVQSPHGLPTPPTPNRLDPDDLSDEDEDLQDSLPYKRSSPPTPMSQIAVLDDEKSSFVTTKSQMLATLSVRRKSDLEGADSLRREYASGFFSWRNMVDGLEKEKQAAEEAQNAAEAAEDQREATPLATPSVEASRRRQFNSQLELDQALELSKQTHAEEQARAKDAERLALTVPDMVKEAIVPDMLTSRAQKESLFRDDNNKVDFNEALSAFAFEPPKIVFSAEEQDLFEKAFVSNGHKQWGHIATNVPGKSYKECIQHYYATKKQFGYKHMFPKKGKGGRAGGRRKTNALLSDLSLRSDDGTGKVEMTETGRPKRAAAPTNFDRRQQQTVDTAPVRRARGTNASKPADGADMAERPKRGRAAGKDKSQGKRVKAPNATPAAAIPGKKVSGPDGTPNDSASEDVVKSVETKDAELLASLKTVKPSLQMAAPQADYTDEWMKAPTVSLSQTQVDILRGPISGKVQLVPQEPSSLISGERMAPKALQPQPDQDAKPPAEALAAPKKGRGTNGSSSYWSTGEQQKVADFIKFFGTNYEEYAKRIRAKTAQMVKNQIQRLIKDGKNPHIEEQLNQADEANKKEPNRISNLIATGQLEPPLSQPNNGQSPQRSLAPTNKKPIVVVKQDKDEKVNTRGRADSHVAVAPKPAEIAIESASPVRRPRVESNASTKSNTQFQIQPASLGAQGQPPLYYDSVPKNVDKAFAAPANEQPAPPQTAQPVQESRPKWSIPDKYVPHEAFSSGYNANHARSAQEQQPPAPTYARETVSSGSRDWQPMTSTVRQEPDPGRLVPPHAPPVSSERSGRVPLPLDGPAGPAQPHDPYRQNHRPALSPSLSVMNTPVPRPNSVPQSSTLEHQPHPSAVHGSSHYQSQPAPSSAPAPTPAPTSAPKRSMIHDLLNDDAPSPKRITSDTREPIPVPTPPPAAHPPPSSYQPAHQPYSRPPLPHQHPGMHEAPQYSRREEPRDRHTQHLYDRGPVPPPQLPPQHAPQHVQQHPPQQHAQPHAQQHQQHPQSQHQQLSQQQQHPQSHYQPSAHDHNRHAYPHQHQPQHQHQHQPPPSYGAPPPDPSRAGGYYGVSPQPTQPGYAAPPPQSRYQHASHPAPPSHQHQVGPPYDYSRTPSMSSRPLPDHTLGASGAYRPPLGQPAGPPPMINRPSSGFGHHAPPPHASSLPPHGHPPPPQYSLERTYTPGAYQGYPPPR